MGIQCATDLVNLIDELMNRETELYASGVAWPLAVVAGVFADVVTTIVTGVKIDTLILWGRRSTGMAGGQLHRALLRPRSPRGLLHRDIGQRPLVVAAAGPTACTVIGTLMLGVVIALVLAWTALIIGLLIVRPQGLALREAIWILPDPANGRTPATIDGKYPATNPATTAAQQVNALQVTVLKTTAALIVDDYRPDLALASILARAMSGRC